MRRTGPAIALAACAACASPPPPAPADHLFVWAGDSARTASDFLAVIDAAPSSPDYGRVVASIATGAAGTSPHHTEAELGVNGHLLANGFGSGRTWLFDLTRPREPKILTSFGVLAGFSHPHSSAAAPSHAHGAPATGPAVSTHATGGLVEMDERGTVVRSSSATDRDIADRFFYPYAAAPLPAVDRVVTTTTVMDAGNKSATSEWVQLWRLSDLTLLKSIALRPGPRGDEHRFTGEPRVLPDGKSVYVHTFNCGLYLVRGTEGVSPAATFVRSFEGRDCGVPILTGRYWLQPVPRSHALVALDVSDPEHPREVSSVTLGDDESPHWIAIDGTGRRVVLNSGGGRGNRLFIIDFDPNTGALSVDQRFRDAGATRPGVSMTGKTWPHGFTAKAVPHGTVFSR